MLSNFIKKLLFTRKFFMNHGSIEVMDRKQILLSSRLIHVLQQQNHYADIKKILKDDFHEISNHFGSKRLDLLKNVEDIFDMYGLGKLELVSTDEKKKTAKLNLYNSSLAHAHMESKTPTERPVCHLTEGVLAGMFSFIYDTDVDCQETKCFAKDDEYCEFVIKEVST